MPEHEPHPLLKGLAEHSAFGDTRDDIHRQAAIEFALCAPHVRVDTLHKLTDQITADDGVSLRRKSQLLGLDRELRTLHERMRRVGR